MASRVTSVATALRRTAPSPASSASAAAWGLALSLAPAVAAALAQVEGKARTSLPMRDNEAAWGVGAKRPRGGASAAPTTGA